MTSTKNNQFSILQVEDFQELQALQELNLSDDGLIWNLVSFNVGVEIGQILALGCIFWVLRIWRASQSFDRMSFSINVFLMLGGFLLMGYQIAGYLYL